jgi:hypothetical protein
MFQIDISTYPDEAKSLLKIFINDDSIKWKQCKKCKKYYPVNRMFFMTEKRINDGFENSCRICRGGHFLSADFVNNPENFSVSTKLKKGLNKKYFDTYDKIIIEYEQYLKTDIVPYNSFITDFFYTIIKYLIEEKYSMSDDDILHINRDWVKQHKIYSYNIKKFNGSIVQMINAVYPDRFKPWQFITTGRNYWNDSNNAIDAINWFIDRLYKDNVISCIEDIPNNVTGCTLSNYGLSSLNEKYGHLYNIINIIYPNKFYPL